MGGDTSQAARSSMHGYDAGMIGDMAGILGPPSTYAAANANAPSPFAIYLAEDESLQAGNQQDQQPDALMDAVLRLFSLDESDPLANGGEEDEEDVVVDLEDQQLRTDRLRGITLSLDQLWWSGQVYMAAAAEKLADGSRDSRWRIPMGNSGLLDAFLMIVATADIQNSLMIHVLRLIGNTCADTDENRARVVSRGSLQAIIALLKDKSLVPFVVPVLFNICFDYEPAQKQASEFNLSTALVQFISDPDFEEHRPFLGYACKLLDMVVVQPNEPSLAPENTVEVLLNLAVSGTSPLDLEDFISVVSSATKYLQHTRFQVALCNSMALYAALRLVLVSYTRIEDSLGEAADPDEEDTKRLAVWRTEMNQVLSDISALPEFAARCPVNSTMSSYLRKWLSSPQLQLQVCACIMLGNLARSDEVCEEFVQKSRIHKPLMDILTTATDSQVLYAAIGFLKNLALPARNKIKLGNADLIEILPRLWAMDTLPQIQYSAISLARQLLIGNFANVLRISAPLSADPDSPANEKSRLSVLISIFGRSDAEPVRMEIARALAAVCRVLAARNPSPGTDAVALQTRRRELFERHRDIGVPLSFLVSQTKWPVVRSEGWFVLALLARTEESVQCVADIMHEIDVFTPLMDLMTGKTFIERMSSPMTSPTEATSSLLAELMAAKAGGQGNGGAAKAGTTKEAEMARIDRENALVLVSELLRRRGSTMAFMRRIAFEELLQDGGSLHVENLAAQAASPPPLPLTQTSSESSFMMDSVMGDSNHEMFN
ncbi:hypothetical protein V502_07175 [Pseudogymnoascus sp. VKM F-4520 (FW-2644)]|nr:hypothetical protein V502_07175 [Pseudogymnoascus sp. VKM F-4520 (FW-2644)]